MEPTTQSRQSNKRDVTIAAILGGIAGFAFNPIPLLFDAAWLSWLLVPSFAAAGAVAALLFPGAARPVDRPAGGTVIVLTPKVKWLVVALFFVFAALVLVARG